MKSTIMRIEQFRSEILDNERDLFIYLPPGYTESEDRRYPVLYMHDGQNLFHPAMNGQSWNLHHTADRLIANGSIEEMIIVGIANMGLERASEFMHPLDGVLYKNDKENITPRGILYERFLIEEIKPYVDGMLRTKPGAADTALMGSSRGGKVTYHIGIRRPDVFGKLGILSPYFYYVNPLSLEEHRMYASFSSKSPLSKIWIDTGGREGVLIMEKHVRQVVSEMLEAGYEANHQLAYYYDPAAEHTEQAWEGRADYPLLHLFGKSGAQCGLSLQQTQATALDRGPIRFVPTAEFDNGLKITPLGGQYRVDAPGVASVEETGAVVPLQGGKASGAYSFNGMEVPFQIDL